MLVGDKILEVSVGLIMMRPLVAAGILITIK